MEDLKKRVLKRKLKNDTFNEKELKALVYRVTGSRKYCDSIDFIKTASHSAGEYKIYSQNGRIIIEASDSISAAVGFNYYLTDVCRCYFGPINQNMNLPEDVCLNFEQHCGRSEFIYRYFMNYCTYSYTMLFCGYEEYERLTDWMLLSGVNLMLNIVGHEIVVRDTLINLGYSEEEACSYITGPAYLPWFYMGNMSSFGGNLSKKWFEKQKKLGNWINNKMRKFGVAIVMPGFYGLVPEDFGNKSAGSCPKNQGLWCNAFKRPALLSNNDSGFNIFADEFYFQTKKHFGNIEYFSGDPFHEGGDATEFDVAAFGNKIVSKMKQHNKEGIWIFQGWPPNPGKEILSELSKDDVIIIYLSANSKNSEKSVFDGFPWIYTSTHNFGATRSVKGNIKGFLSDPYNWGKNDSGNVIVGTGMAMEGIEMDEMVFDAFSRTSVSSMPDVYDFIEKDVLARYGYFSDNLKKIYKTAVDKIYVLNADNAYAGNESILCARPSIGVKAVSYWAYIQDGYTLYDVIEICKGLFAEYSKLKRNQCYLMDLADFSRQAVAELARVYAARFEKYYNENNKKNFKIWADKFLSLFDITDSLMSVCKTTRVYDYLKRAENYDEDDKEINLFNAKNLIFLWSNKEGADELRDYAHREWCGNMSFYKRRWEMFFNRLSCGFINGCENDISWKDIDYSHIFESYKREALVISFEEAVKKTIVLCGEEKP